MNSHLIAPRMPVSVVQNLVRSAYEYSVTPFDSFDAGIEHIEIENLMAGLPKAALMTPWGITPWGGQGTWNGLTVACGPENMKALLAENVYPDCFRAENVFRMRLSPWETLTEFDLKLAKFIGWKDSKLFPVIRVHEAGRPERFVSHPEALFLTSAFQASTAVYKKIDKDLDAFLEDEDRGHPICQIAKNGKMKLVWKWAPKYDRLREKTLDAKSEERRKYYEKLGLNILGLKELLEP